MVDTTLNDGFTSNKDLENYKKTNIYNLGIETVKRFVKEYQVDCDWNEAGKFFATSRLEDRKVLTNFSRTLTNLNFEHYLLNKNDLKERLGNFYNLALYTKGGILLHQQKLSRGMINALPNNVELYENSYLLNWANKKDYILCKFEAGNITTKNIIFATNGFLKSLGLKSNYNFPITLTASMTRTLTDKEFKSIGEPDEWGILPVRPLATIRLTKIENIN